MGGVPMVVAMAGCPLRPVGGALLTGRSGQTVAMASDARPPMVIAHRGASGQAPENTVEAFELAVAQGADAIELDVRRTGDDRLIVHHDARLPDGRAIVDLGVAQLPGHVPHLSAALDACVGARVNLEIKNDPNDPDFDEGRRLAAEVVALLGARPDLPERWLVSSFDLATIEMARSIDPRIPTAYLVLEVGRAVVEAAVSGGHRALHPWVHTLDRVGVEAAHEVGLEVNVWTCNEPERMRELIEWGVDGICTDLPELARRLVGST